ncbi:flippase [Neobacillus soli]|uniref:flippase n=1 Tax=Neobacillus soli TaxID=220688 RepID=UPI00082439C7|nr:flippase [Neobacillus soli]
MKTENIKLNYLYNVLNQLLIVALPIITTPYISRTLGVEGVGVASYIGSIANYFILFAMLGLNNYGNRTIAMVRDNQEKLNRTFSSIYCIQLFSALFIIILYIIYVNFLSNGNKYLSLIMIINVVSALFDINWFFFGIEKFKLTVTRTAFIKVIFVIFIFCLVKDANDLWIYLLLLSSGNLVSQVALWVFLRKYVKLVFPKWYEVKKHIAPNLILFIPVIAISLYTVMDKIMLGAIADSIAENGYFESAVKIIGIPLGVITALGTVMLPKISNLLVQKKDDQVSKYLRKSMKFVMFLAWALAFGISGIAKEFVPWFFGKEFIKSILIIQILSFTVVFISWANVIRTQYLIPYKKDNVYIVSVILGAIVNLISNFILIQKIGAVGAAISTVLAEATVCIYQTYAVKNQINIKSLIKDSFVFQIIGFMMYILLRVIGNTFQGGPLSVAIEIIIGAMFYLICLLIIMVLKKDEDILVLINYFKGKLKNY